MTRISSWDRARVATTTLALAMIFLTFPGGHAQSQAAAAPNRQDPESYQISVDVDLVVLPVTVRDRHGQFVSDLQADDFKVYEDRVLQPIRLFQHEDIPVIAGLLVDHSGSMQPKIAEVIAGARAFARSSNPKDRMFVVNFNETVSLGLPDAIRIHRERRPARTRDLAGSRRRRDGALRRDRQGAGAIRGRQPGQESVDRHQRWRRQCQRAQPGAGFADGGAFQRHHLHRRSLCAGRSRRESEGAQPPGAGDGWRSLLPRPTQRGSGDLRAHRPGHSESIHHRICFHERAAGGAYRTIRVAAQAPGHGRLFVRTRPGYIAGAQLSRPETENEK